MNRQQVVGAFTSYNRIWYANSKKIVDDLCGVEIGAKPPATYYEGMQNLKKRIVAKATADHGEQYGQQLRQRFDLSTKIFLENDAAIRRGEPEPACMLQYWEIRNKSEANEEATVTMKATTGIRVERERAVRIRRRVACGCCKVTCKRQKIDMIKVEL